MSVKHTLAGFLLALAALPAFAAFPTVVSSELTSTTATTTHVVNIPGDACANGSLLVGVAAESDVANDFTFPAGYNSLLLRQGNSEMGEPFYHECDGSEGATFSVTSSISAPGAFIVYKITGSDFAADPEATATGNTAATTADPPTLTPTGGAKDYLWIPVGVQDENAGTFTSCPTNYTGGNCASGGSGAGGGGSDEVKIAYSHRTNNATSEDPGVFTWSSSDTWDAYTIVVHPSSATPPSFSSAPALDDCDSDSCTYDFTPDASADLYWATYAPGASAPADCPAVQAASGALDDGSAAVTGADSVEIPYTLASQSTYFCLSNGDGDSGVEDDLARLRDPRSGFAFVTFAAATNICDLDADFTPDCAVGDIFEYETAANENAGCAIAILTDGDVTTTPTSPGDCDGRLTIEASYEDVSTATGIFTAPTLGNFAADDTVYLNNLAPSCDPQTDILVLDVDEAMPTIDFQVFGDCEDPEGDALTASIVAGTLPNGTSAGGTGNLDWTGTPDTEDEAGEGITVRVTDIAGEYDEYTFTVYPIDTWTVPNLVGRTASEAAGDICDAAPWRCEDVGFGISGLTCDAGTTGLVLTQDPAAAAEAEPFAEITTTLARKCAAGGSDKVKRMRARKTPGAIRVVH